MFGIFLDRSPEMAVALMGVLKAERLTCLWIRRILSIAPESCCRMRDVASVVTSSGIRDRLPSEAHQVLILDQDEDLRSESTENYAAVTSSEQRAYVIYTSRFYGNAERGGRNASRIDESLCMDVAGLSIPAG